METGLQSACQIRIEAKGPQTSGCTSKDPRIIRQVAHEFESLLIEQILKSVKLGEFSEDGNSASGSMMALAQENLARLISQNGGIGMASFLEKALNQTSSPAANATSSGVTPTGATDSSLAVPP
jgi:Rod binding domain-containing protein